MKRKVIQIANSTQLVSLPRKWSQKYGVQKGDEIDVNENKNTLIISTERVKIVNELKVDVSGLLPILVDRFLARSYQKGYDRITIIFDSHEQLITIRNKVKELLGFEVMDISNSVCSIQSISSKLEIDFEPVLRKAFIAVLDMADTCLDAYEKSDKEVLENFYHKDFDVNKFCYFCLRHINKEMSGDFGTYILYYLVEMLEDVGDSYKELATHLRETSPKKDIGKMLKGANKVFRTGYDFFYNPTISKANEAMKDYKEILINIRNNYKRLEDDADLIALSIIEQILRQVYHFYTMRLDTLKELEGK